MNRLGGWLAAVFFAAIPWDISKVLFPPYQSSPGSQTTLDLVRIAMIFLISWGLITSVRQGVVGTAKKLSLAPLFWAVIPLFLAALFSFAGSQQLLASVKEYIRLLILLAVGVSVALCLESKRDLDRILLAIFSMATLAGLFGIVQYLTGQWIWGNGINTESLRRVNSIFMDPNIFARYLNVSILGTLVLLVYRSWEFRLVYLFGLLIQLLALGLTFSRTGWLILFCGLIMLLLIQLLKGWKKGWIGISGLFAAVLILLVIPATRERILTLTGGFEALGQRQHLLQGGWAMFIEHPLVGVGLGNFQWALENPYHYLVPWSDAVTRSHTSLVTVAAEMGLLGVLAMLCFLIAVIVMNRRVSTELKPYSLCLTLGILVIWISSLGEGRFFEDPLMWGFWGLSLALQWKYWWEGWDN